MLSADAIESVFHPFREEIQIHRYGNLSDSIPRGLNVRERYRYTRSFHRVSGNQAWTTIRPFPITTL